MSLSYFYSVAAFIALFSVSVNGAAAEGNPTEDRPQTAAEVEALIEVARERIGRIDWRMTALDDEREEFYREAREAQRQRFEVRRQVTEDDEDILHLIERMEELQREMHEVRSALGSHMAEHPDYIAQQEVQQNVSTLIREANAETAELSNERVRVQLELQALERRLHEVRGETDQDSESNEQNQHYSLEVPDNL